MSELPSEINSHQFGDKVRIRSGLYKGVRGTIKAEVDGVLEIQLDTSEVIYAMLEEITNYSLAARRAWKVMPKRAGRPQLSAPRKKMVSMRLDVNVWNRLSKAVELGLISNREETVNTWLSNQLDVLLSDSTNSNETNDTSD
jgi:hypothetical protein